ncbi:hypothetical protein Lfu02_09950 [Longispora fulva]|uniref:Ornithine cyclodeaminase n=1 Tax=Longispora fulva TaxID=619741 RepID=A0A8J7GEN9_9ACTN|nr:hypothetical protein [Longispora fulva]MBG6135142.1 hypothetical protein [Longispora fulva]GIG56623.1 hypothetical protein Lfu02_09950 [Longispora fulva]
MRHISVDAELDGLLPVDEAVRLLRVALLAGAPDHPSPRDPAGSTPRDPAGPMPRDLAGPGVGAAAGPGGADRRPHEPASRPPGLTPAHQHHGTTPAGRFLAAGLRGDGPQATIVFDDRTGAVTGLVVGTGLGDLRAAATAVIAAEHLAAVYPHRMTILGTGPRAFAQLRLLAARIRPTEILLHGSDAGDLVARARTQLGLTVTAVRDPAAAVRGAQLVVTDGLGLDPDWVSRGTHVSALDWHRVLPPALLARADRVVTDAPRSARSRLGALGSPAVPEDLADLVAGRAPGRRAPDEVTLLLTCGVPGAELALARAALRRAADPEGQPGPGRGHRRANYRRRTPHAQP